MNTEISSIITRILSGGATAEDKRLLLQWFQENENHLHEFGQVEAIWNALEILKNTDKFNQEEGYSRFQQKIQAHRQSKDAKTRKLPLLDYIIRIAAVIAVALVLPFAVTQYFSGKNHIANRKFEVVAPKGSRSIVSLPDGTRIWLNSESRLTYPERFEGKTREVYLEGEGYFMVSKDRKHPFIVRTSDINVKVLGTTFNVKSYPSENTIQTTLVEGSVIIENNKKGTANSEIIRLKPNQQAIYVRQFGISAKKPSAPAPKLVKQTRPVSDSIKQVSINKSVNMEAVTSWKDNKLYFDDESFQTIADKLERRFGVSIYFTDNEIVKFRFSGRFDQISIEEALAALKFASAFQYTIEKEKIYIGLKNR